MKSHVRFDSDGEAEEVKQNPDVEPKQHSQATKTIEKKQRPQPRGKGNKKGKEKPIRAQIRSIERLLNNRGDKLSEAAKKAQRERLEELIRIRDEHDRRSKEKANIKQYRMLKFFERRKLQRKLDKILENGDKPKDAQEKQQVMKDLNYIDRYPKNKKYVALFPSNGHTEESKKRVEEMRAFIEGDNQKTVDIAVPNAKQGTSSDDQAAEPETDDFFLFET